MPANICVEGHLWSKLAYQVFIELRILHDLQIHKHLNKASTLIFWQLFA